MEDTENHPPAGMSWNTGGIENPTMAQCKRVEKWLRTLKKDRRVNDQL